MRLRPWTVGDLDCVRRAAADPRILVGTTVPAVFTEEAGTAFLRRQQQRAEAGEGWSSAIVDAATERALGLLWLGVRYTVIWTALILAVFVPLSVRLYQCTATR